MYVLVLLYSLFMDKKTTSLLVFYMSHAIFRNKICILHWTWLFSPLTHLYFLYCMHDFQTTGTTTGARRKSSIQNELLLNVCFLSLSPPSFCIIIVPHLTVLCPKTLEAVLMFHMTVCLMIEITNLYLCLGTSVWVPVFLPSLPEYSNNHLFLSFFEKCINNCINKVEVV